MVKHAQRCNFALVKAQVRQLFRCCVESGWIAIACAERPGIPDEMRPTITLVNAEGVRCTIAKWGRDGHACFDPIYAALLHFESLTRSLKLMYESAFEWKHAPEEF